MMPKSDIYATLTEIFQEVFDDPSIEVKPTTSAADIPAWDSFNNINILLAIEMRLGVKFTTGEIEKMSNAGDLVRAIATKKK
jgi:acyl carrier protein